MPVATSYRRSWLFDALHPCYAGDLGLAPNPKLVARVKAADLVVLVGGRLGEIPSQGYSLFGIPAPQTHLRARPPRRRGTRAGSTARISPSTPRRSAWPPRSPPWSRRRERPWSAETAAAHADYLSLGRGRDPATRRRQSRRRDGSTARAAAGRCHPVQRRRQLRRLDPSLLPLPRIRDPYCPDLGVDGVRRARRRSR